MQIIRLFVLGLVCMGFVTACAPPQQRASQATTTAPVPESGGANDFRERKSVIQADMLRNRQDAIFFAYHLADDGQLIDQWNCLGSPVSSTESVEPNNASPYSYDGTERGWEVRLEGNQTGYSTEMMGIDGTYGEPAPFLFCITPEGHYEQWSIFDKVRVTTVPRVYPTRVVRIDTAYATKLAEAQKLLATGKCVNDNLDPVDCAIVRQNIEGIRRE